MADVIRKPILRLNIPAAVPALAPAAVPRPRPRAVIGDDDIAMRAILRTIDPMADGEITAAEIRRGYAMIAAHDTTPRSVLDTIICLDRPYGQVPPINQAVIGQSRRVDLAAMLGIVIGFEKATAQSLIDKARAKNPADVVPFLAKEIATLSLAGASVYGAYILAGKGAASIGAKLSAAKAGTLGVSGAVGTAFAVANLSVLTVGAGMAGAIFLALGVFKASDVMIDHRDLLEPKYFKDQRILMGLKEGRLAVPNPAPDPLFVI